MGKIGTIFLFASRWYPPFSTSHRVEWDANILDLMGTYHFVHTEETVRMGRLQITRPLTASQPSHYSSLLVYGVPYSNLRVWFIKEVHV